MSRTSQTSFSQHLFDEGITISSSTEESSIGDSGESLLIFIGPSDEGTCLSLTTLPKDSFDSILLTFFLRDIDLSILPIGLYN